MSSHDPSLPFRRHLREQEQWRRRAAAVQLGNTPAGPDLVDILLGQARELLRRTDLEGSRRAAVVLAFTASEIEAEQLAGRLVLDQRANADIRKWFKDRSKTTRRYTRQCGRCCENGLRSRSTRLPLGGAMGSCIAAMTLLRRRQRKPST